MVINSDFGGNLDPEKKYPRSDTVDEAMPEISRFNAQVIKKVDEKLFTERFMDLLMIEGGKEA